MASDVSDGIEEPTSPLLTYVSYTSLASLLTLGTAVHLEVSFAKLLF